MGCDIPSGPSARTIARATRRPRCVAVRAFGVEDDPAFFLQDRFGILGGVYPRDRCAAQFDEAERKCYATTWFMD